MIPVSRPIIGPAEKQSLLKCIESGWISSSGPIVEQFEDAFSSFVSRRHGISVSNGTAALEIAVQALGLEKGDEVIMPTFAIISCAAAVVKSGAVPVLIDSDPVTWNMAVDKIEAKISKKTKAIMVVHTYGLPVDMQPVLEIAERHGLIIIEDAAEAHGLTCRGRICGSFGKVSVFSFYANKNITTGEGGIIVTDDPIIADKCRALRNLCFSPERRFVHDELGWNYRLTSLQAAVGTAQLANVENIIKRKIEIGETYQKQLRGLSPSILPLQKNHYARNHYWIFGIVIDHPTVDAARIMDCLREEGVDSRPFFWPMHLQPVFKKMGLFRNENYPVAERLGRQGFYIPSGPNLDAGDQTHVIEAVWKVFHDNFH